jgi:hypothetical protein
MAGEYFYADGSGGGGGGSTALISKPFSAVNEIYLECNIYICQVLADAIYNGTVVQGPWFFALIDQDGVFGEFPGLSLINPSGGMTAGSDWSAFSIGGTLGGNPVASGLHTVKMRANVSADIWTFDIDGTGYSQSGLGLFAANGITKFDLVRFGQLGAGSIVSISNITDIKVGTTGVGSSDIIADDFSSGNFSLWPGPFPGGVFGYCLVIPTPVCYGGYQQAWVAFDGDGAFQAV